MFHRLGISLGFLINLLDFNSPILAESSWMPDEFPKFTPSAVIAQSSQCYGPDHGYVVAETENFLVSICGWDEPEYYVGISKNGGETLVLDLVEADPTYFEARNGQYVYYLVDSGKGKFLGVVKGDQQLVLEPIIRGW
ncbi:MAG: hypothetical protein AAGG02_05660 [Cyanobacteria bacterium P01_H01_bin.15]